MKLGNTTIAKVFRGTTEIQKVYRGATLVWENWVRLTGELWKTVKTLSVWEGGATVNTGVQTTPSKVRPVTITFKTVGNQQDGSAQSMNRQIIGYKPDGSSVVLLNTTSTLGPSVNRTDTVTIDGLVQYNRIVATNSGKMAAGTVFTLTVTDWWQQT